MGSEYLIGLDYGTLSARGVLIDTATGEVVTSHAHPYRHAVLSEALPDGTALPPHWALQSAPDYLEAAEAILGTLGRGRAVRGIGLGFTASSPLPARADGTPLSVPHPDRPHAYAKLWKHHAAQPWADRINAAGGDFLRPFGGKLSAEWLLAKAAQMAEEAPDLWAETARFIEGGDWVVWQLTGQEARSLGFAAYKAQWQAGQGYPDVVPGLRARLTEPFPIGHAAGGLSEAWRARTGISGEAKVAVAVIDSHVVMPAVGAVAPGTLVGALGTSAAYLLLDDTARDLPPGIEGVADGGVLPGLWCYESGQAAFGDMLDWFVRLAPLADTQEANFARYATAALALPPGANRLLALDWWNGNRVPLGDAALGGVLLGLTLRTMPVQIYRALLDALGFGARLIADCMVAGGAPIRRVVLTSGLAQSNRALVQHLADILGREVHVPEIDHATAVGAAIHGAVAAGVVRDYTEGAERFGARRFTTYQPAADAAHEALYAQYRALVADPVLRAAMHAFVG
jgi:L-ribulokinase